MLNGSAGWEREGGREGGKKEEMTSLGTPELNLHFGNFFPPFVGRGKDQVVSYPLSRRDRTVASPS